MMNQKKPRACIPDKLLFNWMETQAIIVSIVEAMDVSCSQPAHSEGKKNCIIIYYSWSEFFEKIGILLQLFKFKCVVIF